MGSPYFQLNFKVLPYYCGIATTTIKSCGSATYSYFSICGNATSSTISHVGSPHTHTLLCGNATSSTISHVGAPQPLQLSHTTFYCVQDRYTLTINEKCLLTIFDVFRPVESQASFAVAREPQRWCVFLFSTRDNAHWGGLLEQ
jgi:hypothetical protein